MKPLTIIGGGLAGLSLGIGLRRLGVPVTVWEAGGYPRHRVCGEFISGQGTAVLGRLELMAALNLAGARTARTVLFGGPRNSSPAMTLPQPALCLSRHRLDACLAEEFRKRGGTLLEHQSWDADKFGPGVVRATGRRLQPTESGWRWYGLKVHARQVRLQADLEVHLAPEGYVGLCRLSDDLVNVCGLFRSRASAPAPLTLLPDAAGRPTPLSVNSSRGRKSAPSDFDPVAADSCRLPQARGPGGANLGGSHSRAERWRDQLGGAPGSPLHERLAAATFDEESACAVAGLSLRPHRAEAHPDCCVGDAITLIPPVTGNGMSMALESALGAVEPLASYSRGMTGWDEARRVIARQCDEGFRRRLGWARWLDWALFQPVLRESLVWLTTRSPWVWSTLFARTR